MLQPFIMDGPRSHSSPRCVGAKASPVSGSTILASMFSDSRPADPCLFASSGPIVRVAPPVLSVKP